MYEVEFVHEQFEPWWESLDEEQQEALAARVSLLQQQGPNLKRPYVGEIQGSAFDPAMKELICNESGSLRVLFIFDPRRQAVLLVGGDKTGRWQEWYDEAIPEADDLYRKYLKELEEEAEET